MAGNQARILRIYFSKDKITFIKSDTSSTPALLKQDGIKLELTIGRIFHKALNKARVEGIFEKNDFEFLGSILFQILCLKDQQDARDFVYNELSVILRDESRGLIVLEFDNDASDLALLPWEYLQIENNPDKRIAPFYIGAQKNLKFDLIRFISHGQNISIDYSPKNLKKLTVVQLICNPNTDHLEIIDFQNCFESLNKEFRDEQGKEIMETWRVENPSSESFIQEMKNLDMIEGPYIIHFYGHARMNKENPEIAFINNHGEKQWVPIKVFENLFGKDQKYQQPVVFIMQACESGQLNSKGEGLAYSLIKKEIPFVLAMQNEVTPDTSIAFFKTFYHSMLSGLDIFTAVTTGRVFLGCKYRKHNPDIDLEHYNDNSFGTPVIYSSTITPIRFFAEKKKEDIQGEDRRLVCKKCGTEYDYNSGREYCIKGRCDGSLEVKKTTLDEINKPEPVLSIVNPANLN